MVARVPVLLVALAIGAQAKFARIALRQIKAGKPPPGATVAKTDLSYYKNLNIKVPDNPLADEDRRFYYRHQPRANGEYPAPIPSPTLMPTPAKPATNAPTKPGTPAPTKLAFPHYEQADTPSQKILLANLREMQFYGEVEIGTPPQKIKMVFDTGSGHLVVKGKHCKTKSGGKCQDPGSAGYDYEASTTAKKTLAHWKSHYGSGNTNGKNFWDKICIGGYCAKKMLIAVSELESDSFRKFHFDGIFGMGMIVEAGHGWDLFEQVARDNLEEMKPVFAMFISQKPSSGGSELTIGGYDPEKVAHGAMWQYVPVVPFPYDRYNYWAVFITLFQVNGHDRSFCGSRASYAPTPSPFTFTPPAGGSLAPSRSPTALPTGRPTKSNAPIDGLGCFAIIDSGTTFLSVDHTSYHDVMDQIVNATDPNATKKVCRYVAKEAMYACFSKGKLSPSDFPTLTFGFGGGQNEQAHPNAMFEIHPEEYVDCSKHKYQKVVVTICTPRLKRHVDREKLHFWIFGDYFIRKYYTLFDRGERRLGFVCARGAKGCKVPDIPMVPRITRQPTAFPSKMPDGRRRHR